MHVPLQARPHMSLWIVRGIWFLAPLVDFRNWKKCQFYMYVCMYIALESFIWTAKMYILVLACTNIRSIPLFNIFNLSNIFCFVGITLYYIIYIFKLSYLYMFSNSILKFKRIKIMKQLHKLISYKRNLTKQKLFEHLNAFNSKHFINKISTVA